MLNNLGAAKYGMLDYGKRHTFVLIFLNPWGRKRYIDSSSRICPANEGSLSHHKGGIAWWLGIVYLVLGELRGLLPFDLVGALMITGLSFLWKCFCMREVAQCCVKLAKCRVPDSTSWIGFCHLWHRWGRLRSGLCFERRLVFAKCGHLVRSARPVRIPIQVVGFSWYDLPDESMLQWWNLQM